MTGSVVFLPEAFPALPDVQRLNVGVPDAQRLLEGAEAHLAQMAIPYMVSVHEDFVNRCVDMVFRSQGKSPEDLDYKTRQLVRIHDTLVGLGAKSPEPTLLVIFDLVRRIRNQIIHDNGRQGDVVDVANQMAEEARVEWRRRAKRPLASDGSGRLLLGSSELFAVLVSLKSLVDQINVAMQSTLSVDAWAQIAIEDFLSTHPRGMNPEQTRRKLRGYTSHYYAGLPDVQNIIERAVSTLNDNG